MDSTGGDSYDCLPWEIPTHFVKKESRSPYFSVLLTTSSEPPMRHYDAMFEITSGNGSKWSRGDIVRFRSAYHHQEKWQEWFIQEEDKKFLKRNTAIPHYASRQYAIILARYRWTKNKWNGVFRDYGTILMFLTGRRKGHVRRFYAFSPYELVARYPSIINAEIPRDLKAMLLELRSKHDIQLQTEEGRNKYLEILYRKFNPKENIHDRRGSN